MSNRQHQPRGGEGALHSLVGMARTESPEVVQAFVARRMCTPESILSRDASGS